MHNLKSQGKIAQSQSLIDLIARHKDLADYFRVSCPPTQYQQLAVQLMRQGIAHRSRNQKHYNIAYVKHNRFLSPSQKAEVSPKVTQIIPLNQQPIKIYGKPKVKLDDQYFTPAEQSQQYYSQQYIQGIKRFQSQKNLDCYLPHGNVIEKQQKQQVNSVMPAKNQQQNELENEEEEKYLSSRTPQNIDPQKESRKTIGNKREQNQSKNLQKQRLKKKQADRADKKHQKIDLKIQSNFRTTMKAEKPNERLQEAQSPKNIAHHQKYDEVGSKIKFLIDRDKKNKKLQQKLQQQSKKIQKLEQRQERLLLRQYEQSKEINKQSIHPRKQMPCCCTSDEQINSKILQMKTLQNYSFSKMLPNLHSKVSPIKSYKISANPVYPMTSSDSSDSSDEQIVVAVR